MLSSTRACPLLHGSEPSNSNHASELFAIGRKGLEIGNEVVDFVILGNSGKNHLCPGNLGLGVFDIVAESVFIPCQARVLVGL